LEGRVMFARPSSEPLRDNGLDVVGAGQPLWPAACKIR